MYGYYVLKFFKNNVHPTGTGNQELLQPQKKVILIFKCRPTNNYNDNSLHANPLARSPGQVNLDFDK
jgi:hypothetical protein